jgi:xanthine dehydrogenase accessory factor
MSDLTQAVRKLHRAHKPFVLIEMIEGKGSMPRHTGVKMIVRQDGTPVGTIGGGRLEFEAIERARALFAAPGDLTYTFTMTNEDAALSDMICGGTGTLALRYLTGDGAAELLKTLEEEERAQGRLIILGAGHVSRALAQGAKLLEKPVTVLDDRADLLTKARFPDCTCIQIPDFDHMPALDVQPQDAIAIMTRGHLGDMAALRWALKTNAGYLGMIGSHRKRDMLYDAMRREGVTDAQLRQVHSPIGLSLGAETPGEIAVVILAELIQEQKARQKQKGADTNAANHTD